MQSASDFLNTFRLLQHVWHESQWHAASLVADELLNARYPTNAPTPTEIMIHPLYVINKSLMYTIPSDAFGLLG